MVGLLLNIIFVSVLKAFLGLDMFNQYQQSALKDEAVLGNFEGQGSPKLHNP